MVSILVFGDASMDNLQDSARRICANINRESTRIMILNTFHLQHVGLTGFGEQGLPQITVMDEQCENPVEMLNKSIDACPDDDICLFDANLTVTARWLDDLRKEQEDSHALCSRLGLVSPLSDIMFTPEGRVVHPLPSMRNTSKAIRYLHRDRSEEKMEIPTIVNGCLYIPRIILDAVGRFDTENYHHLMPAIHDFCFRARILGYRHTLSDCAIVPYRNAWIAEPATSKEENEILLKTYPVLMQEANAAPWQEWMDRIDKKIALHQILDNGRKNILYVLHRDFSDDAADHVGGTQFHVKDLVREIRKFHNVAVLARDWGSLRLTAYNNNEKIVLKLPVSASASYPQMFNQEIALLFRRIYQAIRFDLVHVHHIYQMSLDVFYEAKRAGIPMVCTLHDYYFLCPSMKMIDQSKVCCIGRVDEQQCRECWKAHSRAFQLPVQIPYLERWREECCKALMLNDQIYTPSEASKSIIVQYYPQLCNLIQVIPHGIDIYRDTTAYPHNAGISHDVTGNVDVLPDEQGGTMIGWAILKGIPSEMTRIVVKISPDNSEPLYLFAEKTARADVADTFGEEYIHSGFSVSIPKAYLMQKINIDIGVLYEGVLYLRGISQELGPVLRVEPRTFNVAFVGGLSVEKGSEIALKMIKAGPKDIGWFMIGGCGDRNLKYYNKSNFTDLDWYSREDLPLLLKRASIDLICILPILPETYCYVLSEAMACNVPVLATDIGALSERIRKDHSGWLIPVKDAAAAALKQIAYLRQHPEEIEKVRNHLTALDKRDIRQMDMDYLLSYEPLLAHDSADHPYQCTANTLLEARGTDGCDKCKEMAAHIAQIENSRTYKIVRAYEQARIPGKNSLMSFAYSMAKKLKMDV